MAAGVEGPGVEGASDEVIDPEVRNGPHHDLSSQSAAVLPRSSTSKVPCSSLPALW